MARARIPAPRLTHLDAANRPAMVDVGAKVASAREATAEARVRLPAAVARALAATGHRTRKGPVFDTAIIAGVQAVKRTHELIPFCHPLPIERCEIDVDARRGGLVVVRCTVGVFHKTGVEMEALTGAVAAALTIYDMCKALSHDIAIEGVRLLAKRGGRRDFARPAGVARAPAPSRSPASHPAAPRRARRRLPSTRAGGGR
ncbi:MAG: cyclic pyranopterin monophosphate synthase MoaC [Steroidobacteraceae bacterium]|jgi:cyclic pyranopterin phosphate synthase|nr:cyclic pyranopterin monophosphate synthase MoaC [Steroidobacteraceae bacterium]